MGLYWVQKPQITLSYLISMPEHTVRSLCLYLLMHSACHWITLYPCLPPPFTSLWPLGILLGSCLLLRMLPTLLSDLSPWPPMHSLVRSLTKTNTTGEHGRIPSGKLWPYPYLMSTHSLMQRLLSQTKTPTWWHSGIGSRTIAMPAPLSVAPYPRARKSQLEVPWGPMCWSSRRC